MWRLLRRLAKTAGIPVVMSPHVVRHTFVTLGRDAGVKLEDLQDGLDHAGPRTTRRYDSDGPASTGPPATSSPPPQRRDGQLDRSCEITSAIPKAWPPTPA